MAGTRDWQIDVYRHGAVFVAVDHDTGEEVGRFAEEGKGWWRVSLRGGRPRGVFIRDGGWEEVTRRMVGS